MCGTITPSEEYTRTVILIRVIINMCLFIAAQFLFDYKNHLTVLMSIPVNLKVEYFNP